MAEVRIGSVNRCRTSEIRLCIGGGSRVRMEKTAIEPSVNITDRLIWKSDTEYGCISSAESNHDRLGNHSDTMLRSCFRMRK
jgi:hypothetical protein